jgi:O-acetylhomoserine (thiol)-lyase
LDEIVRASLAAMGASVSSAEALGEIEAPIFQTAAFGYASAEEMADVFAGRAPGHVYTRLSNPTTLALERRLTAAEDGIGSLATASGMAAIAATTLGLLRPGDEIVAAKGIFGGAVSFFRNVLGRLNIRAVFVDGADTALVEASVTVRTRAIFVETIGNPGMDVPDLPALGRLARARNIPLIVDSTLTTPELVRPGEHGAALVVHSTSKFINGHGTAIGGAVIDTGRFDWSRGPFEDVAAIARRAGAHAFLAHLRLVIARDLGGCPAPQSSFLMLQGLDTLSLRLKVHCENALALARALTDDPRVAAVGYPGLASSPHFERAQRLFGGRAGAVLTLRLGSLARAFAFINALRSARRVANLGETHTLVIHPASTIFREYQPEDRLSLGVSDDLVRVSVGLEPFPVILADFQQALASAEKE